MVSTKRWERWIAVLSFFINISVIFLWIKSGNRVALMLSSTPRFPAQFLTLSILKLCSIYSSEHSDFLVTHVALVGCVMNLRRISYPGFGKFVLDFKEALKGIIEICLVKAPEDFSSLCGISVSIRRTWQAQQLYRRSRNPSIMARCSKGFERRQSTHRHLACCEIFSCFSARVPVRFISQLLL